MITLLAVLAIVFLLAVLVSLSHSGSAELLGAAPFGADRLLTPGADQRVDDTDVRRLHADLAAVRAHIGR